MKNRVVSVIPRRRILAREIPEVGASHGTPSICLAWAPIRLQVMGGEVSKNCVDGSVMKRLKPMLLFPDITKGWTGFALEAIAQLKEQSGMRKHSIGSFRPRQTELLVNSPLGIKPESRLPLSQNVYTGPCSYGSFASSV